MASSGTTTFDLAIDEIVEEAYERCGIQTNSGYNLAKARRSLNVLFSDWGNRGVHLFKIQLNAVALVGSQSQYTSVSGCNDVFGGNTHPAFGFGIFPRGPNTLPNAPAIFPIMFA